MSAIRKYSRPPLNEILKDYPDLNKAIPDKDSFIKKAGGQAIFRCPFADNDCPPADADIQAAMWIALKGHLTQAAKGSADTKPDSDLKRGWLEAGSQKSRIAFMLNYAKTKGIPPAGFNPHQRLQTDN